MGKSNELPGLHLGRRAAPSSQVVVGSRHVQPWSSAWHREPTVPALSKTRAFYVALCTSISSPQNGVTAAHLTVCHVSERACTECSQRLAEPLLSDGRDEYSRPVPSPVGTSAKWPATASLPTNKPELATSRAPSLLSGAQPDNLRQQQLRCTEHLLWRPRATYFLTR